MLTVLSLVTSVKDYIEIAHKLIETQNTNFSISDYTEFGAVLTFLVLSIKDFFINFVSFTWLSKLWSLPLIVPDIASAMISEISVFDTYFTNAFSFLETGLSSSTASLTANNAVISENPFIFGFSKFMTGFMNSFFLFLPTSTAHLITIRRFVMQGLEAGYIAGLGTIAGNFLWLASIILGWRFFVIPWLSFDIFRYALGFFLLVKYIWDSSKDPATTNPSKTALEDKTKTSIFLLNFLLALTEQTSIYPFISNMSFGADGSILESFSSSVFLQPGAVNSLHFLGIHGFYLLGILLGSLSLLQFTVWFWENPAFSIYMWVISSKMKPIRITTSSYYKVLNFLFLYLTMLCAISSIPYFGFDYTISNPLGLIPQDRIINTKSFSPDSATEKILPESAFLSLNPTDKNSRARDGIHASRDRWKERLQKYQAFDASLYDQGVYDILTIEDLNYGFDRFWLRRKLRNHHINFRLFPGPWMRSLKKHLNKPGLSSPRVEFFRILFEQYYHPNFHSTLPESSRTKVSQTKNLFPKLPTPRDSGMVALENSTLKPSLSIFSPFDPGEKQVGERQQVFPSTGISLSQRNQKTKNITQKEFSALRKFSRNLNNRINTSVALRQPGSLLIKDSSSKSNKIYSKSLKSLFTNTSFLGLPVSDTSRVNEISGISNAQSSFRNISKNLLTLKNPNVTNLTFSFLGQNNKWSNNSGLFSLCSSSRANPLGTALLPPWCSNTKTRSLKTKLISDSFKKTNLRKKLSKKEKLLLIYKTNLLSENQALNFTLPSQNSIIQPLNFYLQKEEAFRRKLRYYSTAVVRKLSVGNNAPYFKTMLKKSFYYHKPTLRWKRTMLTAAIRSGLRKKSTLPKKLVNTSNTLSSTLQERSGSKVMPLMIPLSAPINTRETSPVYPPTGLGSQRLVNPSTKSYSVLGKRASRYRYQIYKDVLQYWYYSPFNRLLLKFDVDSFINRQPKAHFVTKKEEGLLHLRRLLLSEHYNTLRWYTSMEHYRTMKTRIGGTKSFASTVYNQQFQGTFKKIRHLFSITPIQGEMPILKFDQTLYNESNVKPIMDSGIFGFPSENQTRIQQRFGAEKQTYAHEESKSNSSFRDPKDLIEQSINLSGAYNQKEQAITQTQIQEYIKEKNYSQLTLLLAGLTQKQRISSPSLSPLSSLPKGFNSLQQGAIIVDPLLLANTTETKTVLFKFLSECKSRLNNPKFYRNYISHRLDKREQRYSEAQKEFEQNLDSLKTWLSPVKTGSVQFQTTGVRKALNDGVFVLNNINPATSSKALLSKEISELKFLPRNSIDKQDLSLSSFAKFEKEKQINQTLKTLEALTLKIKEKESILKLTKTQIKRLNSNIIVTSSQKLINTFLKPFFFVKNTLIKKRSEKNLEWWRQKQRVMKKRSGLLNRKRFSKYEQAYKTEQAIANVLKIENTDPNKFSKEIETFNRATISKVKDKLKISSTTSLYNDIEIEPNKLFSPFSLQRKKIESQDEKTSLDAKLLGSAKKPESPSIFRNLFLQKFRGKKTSRGYRKKPFPATRGYNSYNKPKKRNLNYFTKVGDRTKESLISANDILNRYDLSNSKIDQKLFLNQFRSLKIQTQASKTNFKIESSRLLGKDFLKKSPIKKYKKKSFKKLKRHKFLRNQAKYRKRKIHGIDKLRVLNKKLKRIQAIQDLQNWWWNTYLPNYIQKAQITKSLQKNAVNSLRGPGDNIFDPSAKYKPLSMGQALDIRYKQLAPITINQNVNQNPESAKNRIPQENGLFDQIYENLFNTPASADLGNATLSLPPEVGRTVRDGSATTLVGSARIKEKTFENQQKIANTTNIPFYAGWDDSLRKFVVTNRLLSRRDAGFTASPFLTMKTFNSEPSTIIEFQKAPIQGLNDASFLSLQTEMPFNSYIIDQFIPNNQSFYAPLGWRRFQFRHSLLKNWLTASLSQKQLMSQRFTIQVDSKGTPTVNGSDQNNGKTLSNFEYFNFPLKTPTPSQSTQILQNRRVKKRSKLIKKAPQDLTYVPTGALLTDVLPSHYISIFDKQTRVPRNRYLKRHLSVTDKVNTKLASTYSGKDLALSEMSKNISNINQDAYSNNGDDIKFSLLGPIDGTLMDLTLRKRIKPKSKYHKKRFTKKDGLIFPRRQKFGIRIQNEKNSITNSSLISETANLNENFRLRPSNQTKQNYNTLFNKAKSKKRVPKAKAARLRALRRREFQQVYKPLQRFQPRNGGFIWPGDYLRLEIIQMPKLDSLKTLSSQYTQERNNLSSPRRVEEQALTQKINGSVKNLGSNISPSREQNTTGKIQTKIQTKIKVPPVGLLPRKYLLQKHNLKVLKKKMALSQKIV